MAATDKMEVRGRTFHVYLQTFYGDDVYFATQIDGHEIRDATWSGLRDKLVAQTKKAATKIRVPFTTTDNKDGFVYGVHGGNDNLLAEIDGNKEQISGYYRRDYLQPLSADEKAQHKSLTQQAQLAEERLTTFRDDHAMNLKDEVTAAIAKAGEDG